MVTIYIGKESYKKAKKIVVAKKSYFYIRKKKENNILITIPKKSMPKGGNCVKENVIKAICEEVLKSENLKIDANIIVHHGICGNKWKEGNLNSNGITLNNAEDTDDKIKKIIKLIKENIEPNIKIIKIEDLNEKKNR